MRKALPGIIAQNEGQHARPAPGSHVDDGIGLAHHIAMLGEMSIENAEMTPRLELVAIMGVGDLLGCEMLEMHRLAAIGPNARCHEHQPGKQGRALGRSGKELAGLFRQIKQDGVAVEDDGALIIDSGHLGIGIEGEIFRAELLAAARVDRHGRVREPGLFQIERDLARVGRAVEIEFQHVVCPFVDLKRVVWRAQRMTRPPMDEADGLPK